MAHFHGCHGYHGNGCHGYKKNIELVSKQAVLLIHSYHQVYGFYGYNRSPVQIPKGIYTGKIPISEYTMNCINYLRIASVHEIIQTSLHIYRNVLHKSGTSASMTFTLKHIQKAIRLWRRCKKLQARVMKCHSTQMDCSFRVKSFNSPCEVIRALCYLIPLLVDTHPPTPSPSIPMIPAIFSTCGSITP